MTIESTQLVDDVMRRWPATIRVFLNHRMHCVGCPIACFHTVEDACREHDVDRAVSWPTSGRLRRPRLRRPGRS